MFEESIGRVVLACLAKLVDAALHLRQRPKLRFPETAEIPADRGEQFLAYLVVIHGDTVARRRYVFLMTESKSTRRSV